MKTEAEVKQLIAEHWSYVEGMMVAHNITPNDLRVAKFHYLTAMLHGWKHAKEDSGEAVFTPESAERTTVDGTKVAAEVFGYCQQA